MCLYDMGFGTLRGLLPTRHGLTTITQHRPGLELGQHITRVFMDGSGLQFIAFRNGFGRCTVATRVVGTFTIVHGRATFGTTTFGQVGDRRGLFFLFGTMFTSIFNGSATTPCGVERNSPYKGVSFGNLPTRVYAIIGVPGLTLQRVYFNCPLTLVRGGNYRGVPTRRRKVTIFVGFLVVMMGRGQHIRQGFILRTVVNTIVGVQRGTITLNGGFLDYTSYLEVTPQRYNETILVPKVGNGSQLRGTILRPTRGRLFTQRVTQGSTRVITMGRGTKGTRHGPGVVTVFWVIGQYRVVPTPNLNGTPWYATTTSN